MDMQKNMGRRRILGRALAAAATLALALGLSACGGAPAAGSDAQAGSESQREAKTVVFTDSAGREVEVPAISSAWCLPAIRPPRCSSPLYRKNSPVSPKR